MSILTVRILFFCLVPVGIYLLINGIRLIRKILNSEKLIELPLNESEGKFFVAKAGKYAIWQKGKIFTKTPLKDFHPEIIDLQSGTTVQLSPTLMRITSNSFSESQMELYTFDADTGNYLLKMEPGSAISTFESTLSNFIPLITADRSDYYILIREKVSVGYLFSGILLLIISFGAIVGGLIFGSLAHQLFN